MQSIQVLEVTQVVPPPRAYAESHLKFALNHYPQDKNLELRAFSDTKQDDSQGRFWLSASGNAYEKALDWADQMSAKGCGIYLGYNPRTANAGTKDDVQTVIAAYADIDIYKVDKTIQEVIDFVDSPACPLAPSMIVFSGRGAQAVYFFKADDRKATWRIVQEGIFKVYGEFGADRAVVTDESRVLRLVPYPNQKEGTHNATCIAWVNPDQSDRTLDDLMTAFGVIGKEQMERRAQPQADSTGMIDMNARKLGYRLPETIEDGGRNNSLFKFGCSLRGQGFNKDEIDAAVRTSNSRGNPPLEEAELVKVIASACRYKQGSQSDSGSTPDGEASPIEQHCTDVGNAARFARQHLLVARFCHDFGHWLIWNGKYWQADKTGEVMRLARKTVQSIYQESADAPQGDEKRKLALHAVRSESESRLAAMVNLARSEAELVVSSEIFDQDPHLFNCENGTVDLRTGVIRDHSCEDYITKISPVVYDQNAKADRLERFLSEVFNGDVETIKFVHRAVGYSLTGLTSEQCFFLLHGSGSNGKSVFAKVLMTLMDSYGAHTAAEALMVKKFDGSATPEVAKLRGARFVSASETEDGNRLAEAKIKQLTGGDPVTCRFLNENPFTYVPAYKIWLATNHKPKVSGTDYAIWRRVKLIPFNVRFEGDQKDPNLEAKLLAEMPGILAWAVRGAVEWHRQGLGNCKAVEAATEEYRGESDSLALFLADECATGGVYKAKASELRETYEAWCRDLGETALNARGFGKAMRERGFVFGTARVQNKFGITETVKAWTGVRLKSVLMLVKAA